MLQCVTQCHDACVLSVRHISFDWPITLLLTAATNGQILVWDPKHAVLQVSQSLEKPLLELQHHQSGINCLSSIQLNSSVLLVASGGDDNGLSVSVIQFERSEIDGIELDLAKTYKTSNAHAAQVSGMYISIINLQKFFEIYVI